MDEEVADSQVEKDPRGDVEAAYDHVRSLVLPHLTTLPSVVSGWVASDERLSPDDAVAAMYGIPRQHADNDRELAALLEATQMKALESFNEQAVGQATEKLSNLLGIGQDEA